VEEGNNTGEIRGSKTGERQCEGGGKAREGRIERGAMQRGEARWKKEQGKRKTEQGGQREKKTG
jgi:hypothetical protein